MNDTQLAAIIVALTGIVRARFARVEGLIVPPIAVLFGAGLSVAAAPEHWQEAVLHGMSVALAAVGGMTAIGYAGSNFGQAGASKAVPEAPAPRETPPGSTSGVVALPSREA
jgi:hypothetical protein